MTNAHHETSPNPRREYGKEWLDHPTDPAIPVEEEGRPIWMKASPTQIEAARSEMMRVPEWSQEVSRYPRTVVGKFFTATENNRGFNEIGIGGGQDQGVFTPRSLNPDIKNTDRLVKVLTGGENGYATAAYRGADFLIPEPPIKKGDVEFYPLTFMQFQNKLYTNGGDRGAHTPIQTTFYLPAEIASRFLNDIRENPDLIPSVCDSAVIPGMPEPIYRTPSQGVGIVNPKTLKAAEAAGGYKRLQFDKLWEITEWHQYAHLHGGETPETPR